MPGTDRRHSTSSSEDANAPPPPIRQLSQDGTEIIPTRMSKVTTPKPASNPLQFIKTGPCDLYKAAQEQIKKVEEIKKVEKVKDDSEDWQSNLDNWKCSRRKRQEHIIERVVEAKKLELEEVDRNRRRSKTFNEMIEERSSKGGLRKMSILTYSEDDSNDLTDLGISSNIKEKSSGDFSENQIQNGSTKVNDGSEEVNSSNGHGSNYDGGSSTPATISSPEPEEYTYERAIQGYMNFAEAKIKTPIKGKTEDGKGVNGTGVSANVKIGSMKKEPGGRIGEKLSELEQIRLRSKSTNDINGGEGKQLPKVDVHKRRSLFENVECADPSQVKSADRFPKDFSNSKSVKERLTSLEKGNEEAVTKVNRLSAEVSPHIKETISNLEKQKSVDGSSGKRLSNGDISPQISIKERMNSLEKQHTDGDGTAKVRTPAEEISTISIKERMSSFDASNLNKEPAVKLMPERDTTFKEKLETFKSTEKNQNDVVNSINGRNSPSNNCSDNKESIRSCLDRLEAEEEEEKAEVKKNTSEGVTNPDLEQKTDEPITMGQPKPEQTDSVTEKMETIEDSVPVSSGMETISNANQLVMVDDLEGSGDGAETKPKETENETDNVDKVMEMVKVSEAEMELEMVEVQTNKEVVEGDEVVAPEEGDQLTSVRTDITYDSQTTATGCDVSKTVVTEISLPDAQVPCSRLNISVSVGGKDGTNPEEDEEALDEFPEELHSPSGFRESPYSSKPKTRVRKLTPILTTPKISVAPLKTVCELQIIEEGESADPENENGEEGKKEVESSRSEKYIAVHMTPQQFVPEFYKSNNEVQDFVAKTSSNEMEEDEEQQESSVYTDENIDEVLGKDDEVETCVDDETRFDGISEESKIQKELEIFTPKDATEVLSAVSALKPEITEKAVPPPPPPSANYENVFITNQVPQLNMSSDSDIYATLTFPLGSRPSIEPPKEKPPPPPLELSDDESTKPELPPKPSLRRLDSTKRIKKEIRKKRSDFLGIEGTNDDSYLEPEIYVAPPPDMMAFLQEERRLEQQLYRQSICSESDSNHETAESRDSGVELDRGHVDDICWSKPDVLSEPHSRQNSETFGNTSMTSEEDEILKKEREIIEVLEKEEQWRYGSKNSHSAEQNNIGEKLAVKLRQLEQEKMQLEREREEEEGRRKAEESARRQNEQRLIAKQQQLREQENSTSHSNMDPALGQEALRFERERLQKEQEHLERCRQNLLKQQQNSEPIEIHHRGGPVSHWDTPSNRHSLQEVPIGVPMQDVPRHSMQDVSQSQYQTQMSSGYRYSLPDLQQRDPRTPRPPPPIPPAKPVRPMTQEQWERETNIRNSRIPSADNIPLQIEASSKLRHGSSVPAINVHPGGQQMTRSTLHALSAAPRSRIISNENWMQPKRKVDAPKTNYNYQHWLIQEAEHRRIIEHQQKVSQQLQPKPRSMGYNGQPSANYPCSPPSHHTVGLPLSPPVQGQQSNQKWMSPPRTDKPLPDSVIHTLTQRVQSRENKIPPRRRTENPGAPLPNKIPPPGPDAHNQMNTSGQTQERMLSVSGKKKCSHCSEELGRGAAMIIESLQLFYHIDCFKCCVCHIQLGDGLMGTDVRVRNNKLHCHNCYSSDDEKEETGGGEELHFLPSEVIPEEESDESLSPATLETVTSEDSFDSDREVLPFWCDSLDPFPSGMDETVPDWFRHFYKVYQTNENRKYILMQQINLEMINFEIKKCELLRDIINRLKD